MFETTYPLAVLSLIPAVVPHAVNPFASIHCVPGNGSVKELGISPGARMLMQCEETCWSQSSNWLLCPKSAAANASTAPIDLMNASL
jgi:hypothetical protein